MFNTKNMYVLGMLLCVAVSVAFLPPIDVSAQSYEDPVAKITIVKNGVSIPGDTLQVLDANDLKADLKLEKGNTNHKAELKKTSYINSPYMTLYPCSHTEEALILGAGNLIKGRDSEKEIIFKNAAHTDSGITAYYAGCITELTYTVTNELGKSDSKKVFFKGTFTVSPLPDGQSFTNPNLDEKMLESIQKGNENLMKRFNAAQNAFLAGSGQYFTRFTPQDVVTFAAVFGDKTDQFRHTKTTVNRDFQGGAIWYSPFTLEGGDFSQTDASKDLASWYGFHSYFTYIDAIVFSDGRDQLMQLYRNRCDDTYVIGSNNFDNNYKNTFQSKPDPRIDSFMSGFRSTLKDGTATYTTSLETFKPGCKYVFRYFTKKQFPDPPFVQPDLWVSIYDKVIDPSLYETKPKISFTVNGQKDSYVYDKNKDDGLRFEWSSSNAIKSDVLRVRSVENKNAAIHKSRVRSTKNVHSILAKDSPACPINITSKLKQNIKGTSGSYFISKKDLKSLKEGCSIVLTHSVIGEDKRFAILRYTILIDKRDELENKSVNTQTQSQNDTPQIPATVVAPVNPQVPVSNDPTIFLSANGQKNTILTNLNTDDLTYTWGGTNLKSAYATQKDTCGTSKERNSNSIKGMSGTMSRTRSQVKALKNNCIYTTTIYGTGLNGKTVSQEVTVTIKISSSPVIPVPQNQVIPVTSPNNSQVPSSSPVPVSQSVAPAVNSVVTPNPTIPTSVPPTSPVLSTNPTNSVSTVPVPTISVTWNDVKNAVFTDINQPLTIKWTSTNLKSIRGTTAVTTSVCGNTQEVESSVIKGFSGTHTRSLSQKSALKKGCTYLNTVYGIGLNGEKVSDTATVEIK